MPKTKVEKKQEEKAKKVAASAFVPPKTKAQKLAAIKELGTELDAKFASKTFSRQGDKVRMSVPSIPSNLPSFDRKVLGCGGFPRGRVIEIFGPESAGKTAITMHVIGECQKAGGVAAFVDAEHALSPKFAAILGVNMDELVISQPDCGEEALDIVEALVRSQAVDIVVVDSVTALVPRAELAGEMGDSHMGLQARLMSQACRKLVGICSKTGVTVVFINQIREKVGVTFGNPEVTTGGRALKFFSSVRISATRVAQSKQGLIKDENDKIIGHKMILKNIKNKCADPFEETIVDLYYATGFDKDDDSINHAQEIGVLEGTAWLTFKGEEEKFRRADIDVAKVNVAIKAHYAAIEAKTELVYQQAEKAKKEAKLEKTINQTDNI